jgi:hypothetical protein
MPALPPFQTLTEKDRDRLIGVQFLDRHLEHLRKAAAGPGPLDVGMRPPSGPAPTTPLDLPSPYDAKAPLSGGEVAAHKGLGTPAAGEAKPFSARPWEERHQLPPTIGQKLVHSPISTSLNLLTGHAGGDTEHGPYRGLEGESYTLKHTLYPESLGRTRAGGAGTAEPGAARVLGDLAVDPGAGKGQHGLSRPTLAAPGTVKGGPPPDLDAPKAVPALDAATARTGPGNADVAGVRGPGANILSPPSVDPSQLRQTLSRRATELGWEPGQGASSGNRQAREYAYLAGQTAQIGNKALPVAIPENYSAYGMKPEDLRGAILRQSLAEGKAPPATYQEANDWAARRQHQLGQPTQLPAQWSEEAPLVEDTKPLQYAAFVGMPWLGGAGALASAASAARGIAGSEAGGYLGGMAGKKIAPNSPAGEAVGEGLGSLVGGYASGVGRGAMRRGAPGEPTVRNPMAEGGKVPKELETASRIRPGEAVGHDDLSELPPDMARQLDWSAPHTKVEAEPTPGTAKAAPPPAEEAGVAKGAPPAAPGGQPVTESPVAEAPAPQPAVPGAGPAAAEATPAGRLARLREWVNEVVHRDPWSTLGMKGRGLTTLADPARAVADVLGAAAGKLHPSLARPVGAVARAVTAPGRLVTGTGPVGEVAAHLAAPGPLSVRLGGAAKSLGKWGLGGATLHALGHERTAGLPALATPAAAGNVARYYRDLATGEDPAAYLREFASPYPRIGQFAAHELERGLGKLENVHWSKIPGTVAENTARRFDEAYSAPPKPPPDLSGGPAAPDEDQVQALVDRLRAPASGGAANPPAEPPPFPGGGGPDMDGAAPGQFGRGTGNLAGAGIGGTPGRIEPSPAAAPAAAPAPQAHPVLSPVLSAVQRQMSQVDQQAAANNGQLTPDLAAQKRSLMAVNHMLGKAGENLGAVKAQYKLDDNGLTAAVNDPNHPIRHDAAMKVFSDPATQSEISKLVPGYDPSKPMTREQFNEGYKVSLGVFETLPTWAKVTFLGGLGLSAIGLLSSLFGGGDDDEEDGKGRGGMGWLGPVAGIGGLGAAAFGLSGGQPGRLLDSRFWSGVGGDVRGLWPR